MGSLSSPSFIQSLGLSLFRHSKLLLQGVSKFLRLLQVYEAEYCEKQGRDEVGIS